MVRHIPPRLLNNAQRLMPPRDFYNGVRSSDLALPGNIILFSRLDAGRVGGVECHHRFVLVVNLQGSGAVIVDESITPLSPTEAILVFPYQFHHYTNFERSRIVWLFVTFEITDVARLLPLRNTPLTLTTEAMEHLAQCSDLFESPGGGSKLSLHCGLILEELLISTPTQSVTTPRCRASRDLFQRIGAFIYERLDQPLQVCDIATHVAMSESHLRNTFKAAFGISLARYVRHAKLTSAATLIATTERPITDVGLAVGFESLYSFSRAFKSEMGVSPMAYRRATKSRQDAAAEHRDRGGGRAPASRPATKQPTRFREW